MATEPGWNSVAGVATKLLDGNLVAIAIAVLITFGVPVLLHIIFYRSAAAPPSSNFLLLGPSGAGKTAFTSLTLKARGQIFSRLQKVPPNAHLPVLNTGDRRPSPDVPTASNRYRSVNDPSLKEISRNPVRYRVQDTPGHGKLRVSQGISQLQAMSQSNDAKIKLRGVLFMVDTAALVDEATLRDSATYLHDVLLILQKRALKKGKSSAKVAAEVPVLVAANKQDLFTALPPGSVREKLEAEIDRIRKSKTKGLLDASAGSGMETEEDEVLGNDGGLEGFSFKLLEEEVGVKVDVVGGAVKGDPNEELGSGVRRWEEWVGLCL
ncbi:hypothetical protein N7510_008690 [Penicillium lagena]|uniref:uncharacterized protein n=1 Tax=Penicillium lagena TaxID=94218 RepID=UPI0025409301|nr:uncharacterized protein N7510_008690 [Penicillium lagena]KAJ5605909.1 hypothetical protein N7510_008690 [Penicillium lagena]